MDSADYLVGDIDHCRQHNSKDLYEVVKYTGHVYKDKDKGNNNCRDNFIAFSHYYQCAWY